MSYAVLIFKNEFSFHIIPIRIFSVYLCHGLLTNVRNIRFLQALNHSHFLFIPDWNTTESPLPLRDCTALQKPIQFSSISNRYNLRISKALLLSYYRGIVSEDTQTAVPRGMTPLSARGMSCDVYGHDNEHLQCYVWCPAIIITPGNMTRTREVGGEVTWRGTDF